MPRIRAIESVTLPTGVTRFQDTHSAISTKVQTYVTAGTCETVSKTTTDNGDGTKTIVTTNIWQDQATLDEMNNWMQTNYLALKTEYYANANDSRISTTYTTEEVSE